jgi:glycosyltransferase involved in cell wall biosynthesis
MIHAHMVFHDGFIAYYLSKRYDIPYVLSVRNTDVQLFIKRAFLRPVMRKILNHSAKIIFINPSYKNIILQKYIQNKNRASIEKKSIVLPNGIMDFWFQNRYLDKANAIGNQITIITVADIDYNKNQISVIKSIEELISQGYNIKYQLVGKIVDKHVYKQIINYPFVEYHSPVPKEELLSYYREADIFIMTSFYETFGLVYIEALLQGLPIIYSKNHGIDGFFSQGVVGYSVDSRNYLEIKERIIDIINNYTAISNNINNIDLSLDFSWNEIAKKMVSCYNEILNEK